MRRHTAILLALFLLSACDSDPNDSDSLLITNITVISAGSPVTSSPMNVLVRDGQIVSISDTDALDDKTSAHTLNGTGRYLTPGLIDGHTHLAEIPGMTFDHEHDYPDVAASARRQIPRSYLFHGFTTVVDLNSTPQVVDRWNAEAISPRAFFCGASPVFDGYPMSFMPQPQRYEWMPYFLFDDTRAEDFPEGFEPENHSPSAVVERIHEDGGICVKTHYEKGFGGRGNLPVPTAELARELVAAAHDKGLPVLMHANSEYAQRFGNGTGIDAFAHGMWTWDDRSLTEMHADIHAIVDETIANGIALQPTVQVLYGEQDIHNPDYLEDRRLQQVLPASLIEWYATEDGQWWASRMLEIPIVKELVEAGRWEELDEPPIARVMAVFEYFSSNGGKLLFGSDTPSDPTYANPPGLNGRQEMDRWLAAGVTPAQLFAAATVSNAAFYGLDHEIGTIEEGKRADLLILRQNPLENITAWDTIEYVILNGDVIERSTLSALGASN